MNCAKNDMLSRLRHRIDLFADGSTLLSLLLDPVEDIILESCEPLGRNLSELIRLSALQPDLLLLH